MPEYDATNAELFVYTQRQSEGALARMGHDLKLQADDFSIDVDPENDQLSARIDAGSLEPVDSIIWETREETGELSDGDRREIKQRIDKEVFEVDTYPTIEFTAEAVESTDDGWHVVGQLDMHGEQRQVEFDVVRDRNRAGVEFTLDHTDFEIEPYSAMLGSLQVDPEVVVVFDGPVPSEL